MVHATALPANSPIGPRVLVILGSVREGRVCPKIADWIVGIGKGAFAADFEIIDLRDWPLPMDDEPGIPAARVYRNPHTAAWGRKIVASDAVVFVTPQYNWGYPAPLKNALDHLYEEWRGKPAMIVTYGGHGGSKCARQLKQVTSGLHMKLARTMPSLTIPRDMIEANDGRLVPEHQFAGRTAQVRRAFSDLAGLVD